MATDPLASLRAKLKSGTAPAASSTTSSATDPLASVRKKVQGTSTAPSTSPYTNLLIAIAYTNGHSNPKVWAKQVTDYLAKL
jgi:hypothetical protein